MSTKTYKPQEFAEMLGVSVKTLQRWDREGTLTACRTITNRRYYTHEQYLASAGMAKSQDIKRRSLVTRGKLYSVIRDIMDDKSLSDMAIYENIKLLQQIVDGLMALPAYWQVGIEMTQTVKLDSDLIWKMDMMDVVHEFMDEAPEGSDTVTICRKLMSRIEAAEG